MQNHNHIPPKNITPRSLSYGFAKRHGVVISAIEDKSVTIAHKPNPDVLVLSEIRRALEVPIKLNEISAEAFNTLLTETYESDSSMTAMMIEGMEEELDLKQLMHQMPKPQDLLETQDDAPIIRLLNALFTQAIKQHASDIHIETFENKVIVRFRIDGVLQEVLQIQRVLAPLVTSRIKVMAKLDIAEKRLPQDGRITLRIAGHTVDVRVSTMPSSHGERVVMRLLDKQVARLDLLHLGMTDHALQNVQKLIRIPHGIILVTGPTGSGKTTSLYAMLTVLNEISRNILTIEDPIEFDLPGIGQTQVNPKIDMSFAKGLRSMLRQDPDVVMVGEIRDKETADIAVQASLTGHLVLSTLHTNSAIGAITRLQDMGVEAFLLSSSLIGVIAQRLVRLLCNNCKEPAILTPNERLMLQLQPDEHVNIFQAKGCEVCNQTGYRGRTGIYEVITIDAKLQSMIHQQMNEQEMESYVRQTMPSMRQDGLRRVLAGETTFAEVLRVTSED